VLKDLPNPPVENTSSPVPFFHYLERLKIEKREGWRRFGISQGESVSDHMYRMSLITMLAPPALSSKLDIPRCTKMALVHDMAEGLVGDLTPVDGVPKVEKNRREAETMDWIARSLLGKVHGGVAGQGIKDVWQEYEDSETLESKFVHDVDKIELLLQMVEYERVNDCRVDLSEFSWVARKVVLEEMKEWAKEILDERETLWSEKGVGPRDPTNGDYVREQQDEYYNINTEKVNGDAKVSLAMADE
jgi:putative hydrolase of HD superfamily